MLSLRSFVLFGLFLFCFSASARIDRELLESQKCSAMFSYFEKRYNLPQDILHSISLRETEKAHSIGNVGIVWPWTINVGGKGYHFSSKNEAIKFVKTKLASGKKSIDVGCMQINLKYHSEAFESLDQAFSPRKNIAYAAQFLRSNYELLGNWQEAIGRYHSASPDKAFIYKKAVQKIIQNMPNYKTQIKHLTGNKTHV